MFIVQPCIYFNVLFFITLFITNSRNVLLKVLFIYCARLSYRYFYSYQRSLFIIVSMPFWNPQSYAIQLEFLFQNAFLTYLSNIVSLINMVLI